MTKTQTINARLAVDGIGLPPVWLSYCCEAFYVHEFDIEAGRPHLHMDLDLADHQTHEAMCRQLAMWAGDNGEAQAYWLEWVDAWTWALRSERADGTVIAFFQSYPDQAIAPTGENIHHVPGVGQVRQRAPTPTNPPEALAIIIETIALDRRIRHAFGWSKEDRTLAKVYYHTKLGAWALKAPWIPTHDNIWSFPNFVPMHIGVQTGVYDLEPTMTPLEAWRTISAAVAL